MSLKTKFKTDTEAAASGVWVDYSALPNADGSIPGFKLARMSKQNPKYSLATRRIQKQYAEMGADESTIEMSAGEKEFLRVFVDTILLDWRNFQPEDDGVVLPFSKDAAEKLFASDDWIDLYGDLAEKAQLASTFREKALKAEAKNL